MKRRIVLSLIIFLIAAFIVVLIIFFRPHHYNVQHLMQRSTTRYWKLNTGSLIGYTLIKGKGNIKAFPVIYLHGGPGAGITNREIKTLSLLADEGYDVYLYDQVGCGHSSRLADIRQYTADRHKKDLEEIIGLLRKDKVILIAQSWGAILSGLYIADHPDKVYKLVITATAPVQPANNKLENISAPDSLKLNPPEYLNTNINQQLNSLRTRGMLYMARKFGRKLAADAEADEYATLLTNELNKSMVCDSSHAVIAEGTEGYYVHYRTIMSLGKVKDPRPFLKNVSIPVLIMKAQCDNQAWGYTTEYLSLFKNHEFVVIPNAGHNLFIEQPGIYIKTISTFLKKQISYPSQNVTRSKALR